MSLLLEALHKAEQDRKLDKTIENQPPSSNPSSTTNKKTSIALPLLGLTTSIAVCVALYLSLASEPTRQAKPAEQTIKEELPVATSSNTKKTIKNPQKDQDKINTLYRQKPQPAKTLASPKPQALATSNLQTNHLSRVEALTKIPAITELANKQQKQIPSLDYSAHHFSETAPKNSFIIINEQQLQPGDWLNKELQLIEIYSHYSVLQHNGQTFKLRALNSWINF